MSDVDSTDYGTFGTPPTTGGGDQPVVAVSGLDWLTAALDVEVPLPTVTVPVAARPGWAVRYRTNLAWSELQAWRKRATTGKTTDVALLSRLILANTCIGFVKDDADAVDGTGEPVTFGTIAKQQNVTAADAVRVWLVTDGGISGTSDLVYSRSGYQMPEEADGADPIGA